MKRCQVTLQLDIPDDENLTEFGEDVVNAIAETWECYQNIEVISAHSITISLGEALAQIANVVNHSGQYDNIPYTIQNILSKVN